MLTDFSINLLRIFQKSRILSLVRADPAWLHWRAVNKKSMNAYFLSMTFSFQYIG